MPGVHAVEDTQADQHFFDEQWMLYQKILDHDYLGHRGLFEAARAVLLERFLGFVRRTWTAMTPREMDLVTEHIASRDFPASVPRLESHAAAAGFARVERLARDATGLHGLLAFWNVS